MVSRVYTPLIMPYKRNGQIKPGPGSAGGNVSSAEPEEASSTESGMTTQSALQSIQRYPGQKIPLQAVIHDFHSTMNSLNVDDLTRSEVVLYLKVSQVQASKTESSIPYIKQTLKAAGKTLDDFIARALGKPSQVVKEWVDAMLLQNIHFQETLTQEEQKKLLRSLLDDRESEARKESEQQSAEQQTAGQQSADESPQNLQEAQLEPDKKSEKETRTEGYQKPGQQSLAERTLQKKHKKEGVLPTTAAATSKIKTQKIKTLVTEARQQHNSVEVLKRYNEAIELAQQGQLYQVEGDIRYYKGRYQKAQGNIVEALDSFKQAALLLGATGATGKAANCLYALATLLETNGQTDEAKRYYQQLLDLKGTNHEKLRFKTLNHLGSLLLLSSQTEMAIPLLETAKAMMATLNPPGEVQHDILNNLAYGYKQTKRYAEAEQIYQIALKAAKASGDNARIEDMLEKMKQVQRFR
jgi:tetratricopeptide (TPR) repeat protein